MMAFLAPQHNMVIDKQRFLIICGLPKCGTTYLYSQLKQECEHFVVPLERKEVDYFRGRSNRDEYLSLFPESNGKTIVDASPLYIDDITIAARNIQSALGNDEIRIVVCLRDPLERSYSHYLHDISQHQKLLGHSLYSFYSPPVMAKYVFPVEPRVQYLINLFGRNNVWGFSFENSSVLKFEEKVREFSGLDGSWRLDLSFNPAPGFTAPCSYYSRSSDIEIPVNGDYYILPKKHMLVANRQYSIYRQKIKNSIADSIMASQSLLTRQLDTRELGREAINSIYNDMDAALGLLGMSMPLDRSDRVISSTPSGRVPDSILMRLEKSRSINDTVAFCFDAFLASTSSNSFAVPSIGDSLARDISHMHLAALGDTAATSDICGVQESIIEKHGPISYMLQSLVVKYTAERQYAKVFDLSSRFNGFSDLLWPITIASLVKKRGSSIPKDVLASYAEIGIRIE